MLFKKILRNFLWATLALFVCNFVSAPPTTDETNAFAAAQRAYTAELTKAFDAAEQTTPGSTGKAATGAAATGGTPINWADEIKNAQEDEQKFRALAIADAPNRAEWTKLANKMSEAQQAFAKVVATTDTTVQIDFYTKKQALLGQVTALRGAATSALTGAPSSGAPADPKTLLSGHPLNELTTYNKFLTKRTSPTGATPGGTTATTTTQFEVYNLLEEPEVFTIRAARTAQQQAQNDFNMAKAIFDPTKPHKDPSDIYEYIGDESGRAAASTKIADFYAKRAALQAAQQDLEATQQKQVATKRALKAAQAELVRTAGTVVNQQTTEAFLTVTKADLATKKSRTPTLDQAAAEAFLDDSIAKNGTTLSALNAKQAKTTSDLAEIERLTKVIEQDQRDSDLLRARPQAFSGPVGAAGAGAGGGTGTAATTENFTARNARLQGALAREKAAYESATGPAKAAAKTAVEEAQKNIDASNALARTTAKKSFESAMLARLNTPQAKEQRAQDVVAAAASTDESLQFLTKPGLRGIGTQASINALTAIIGQINTTQNAATNIPNWRTQKGANDVIIADITKNSDEINKAKIENAAFDYLLANPGLKDEIHTKLSNLKTAAEDAQATALTDSTVTPEMRKKWYTDASTSAIYQKMLTDQQQIAETSIPVDPARADSASKAAQQAQEVMKNPEIQRRFMAAATETLKELLTTHEATIRRITTLPRPTKDQAKELQAALVDRKNLVQALAADPLNYVLRLQTTNDQLKTRDLANELANNLFAQKLTEEFIAKSGSTLTVNDPATARPYTNAGGTIDFQLPAGSTVSSLAAHLAKITGSSATTLKDQAGAAFDVMAQTFRTIKEEDSEFQAKLATLRSTVGTAGTVLTIDSKDLEAKLKKAGVPDKTAKAMSIAAAKPATLSTPRPSADLAARLSKKTGSTDAGQEIADQTDPEQKIALAQKRAEELLAEKRKDGKAPKPVELPPDLTRFTVVDSAGKIIFKKGDVSFFETKPKVAGGQYLVELHIDLNEAQNSATFNTRLKEALGGATVRDSSGAVVQTTRLVTSSTELLSAFKVHATQEYSRLVAAESAKTSATNLLTQAAEEAKASVLRVAAGLKEEELSELEKIKLKYLGDEKATSAAKYATDLTELTKKQLKLIQGASTKDLTLSEDGSENSFKGLQRSAGLALAALDESEALSIKKIKRELSGKPKEEQQEKIDAAKKQMEAMRQEILKAFKPLVDKVQQLKEEQAAEETGYSLYDTDTERQAGGKLALLRKQAQDDIDTARKTHSDTIDGFMRKQIGTRTYQKAQADVFKQKAALGDLQQQLAAASDTTTANRLRSQIRAQEASIAAAEAPLKVTEKDINKANVDLKKSIKDAEKERNTLIIAYKKAMNRTIIKEAADKVDELTATIATKKGSALARTTQGKEEIAQLEAERAAARKRMDNPTPLAKRTQQDSEREASMIEEGDSSQVNVEDRVTLRPSKPGADAAEITADQQKQKAALAKESPFSRVAIDPADLYRSKVAFRTQARKVLNNDERKNGSQLTTAEFDAILEQRARSAIKSATRLERRAQEKGDFSALASDEGEASVPAGASPKGAGTRGAKIADTPKISGVLDEAKLESVLRAAALTAAKTAKKPDGLKLSFASRVLGWAGVEKRLSKDSEAALAQQIQEAKISLRKATNAHDNKLLLQAHVGKVRNLSRTPQRAVRNP